MRKFEYVPSSCKPGLDGSVPSFSGKVVLKALRNDERMRLMEEMLRLNLDFDRPEKNETLAQISIVRKMIELTAPLILEVDIKRGEQEYKSYDDLDYEPDAMPILSDIASYVFSLMQGSNIPKN